MGTEGSLIPGMEPKPRRLPDPSDEYWTEGIKTIRTNPPESSNPKDAIGSAKTPLHLIPASAAIELAEALRLGAEKYTPANWAKSPVRSSVYVSAAMRHIFQWQDGHDKDDESGRTHLAHAMACMAIMIDAASRGTLIDDRPVPGRAPDLLEECRREV